MSALVRPPIPFSDLIDWLETETGSSLRNAAHYIRVEDFSDDGCYVVRAEMPGVDPDKDVEIFVEGDLLRIEGHRQEEEIDKHHSEFRYGSFTRTLRLPAGARAAEVKASYADGMLEVRVPMREIEDEVTKVPVERS